MALLIAPLFTVGIAVGGIQNANAGFPTTLFVDEDGMADAGSCDNATGAFSVIQTAIDAANPGDTIIVCPHDTEYAETVQVNVAGITIEGISKPKVNGSNASPAFIINADGVVLSGFKALSTDADCIVINSNDNKVLGNLVEDCGEDGIQVNGNNNLIAGNRTENCQREGIVVDGTNNIIRG